MSIYRFTIVLEYSPHDEVKSHEWIHDKDIEVSFTRLTKSFYRRKCIRCFGILQEGIMHRYNLLIVKRCYITQQYVDHNGCGCRTTRIFT